MPCALARRPEVSRLQERRQTVASLGQCHRTWPEECSEVPTLQGTEKGFSFLLLNKEFSVLCRCIPTFKTPQLKICNGIDVTMSTLSYAHPHLVPLVPVHYSATCWGNWLDLISHAKILANHNVLYCSKVWVRSHL